ncbi:MAG: hypothetical protein FJ206_14205 [Gemmatimonadetes bacterium]|nr:hypothetical protein [Gemmatimonadota bacterium]
MPNLCRYAVLTVVAAGSISPLAAQKKPITQGLVTAAVAGQGVAIIPIEMVVVDPSVAPNTVPGDRPTIRRWVDSLITDGALTRAPEVNWVSPVELRRIARRGGGLVPNPDQMGQSVMRGWSITSVPDPLRSNLRKLVAVAGGWRYALIPAALVFTTDSTGVLAANLSVLLADTRTGRVVWRSMAKGAGGSADQVLGKAVATIFPIEGADPTNPSAP